MQDFVQSPQPVTIVAKMSLIVPTVTAENPHTYREEVERVAGLVDRIHIDLADGVLAPTRLINPVQAWWPEALTVDVHLMYQKPAEHIEPVISLKPTLVILHAEADGDLVSMLGDLKDVGIRPGLALLEASQPEDFMTEILQADHILIFGGKLGYHGGEANMELLDKVAKIKEINGSAEIAWDGGINDENIRQISDAGIDILNVGGFIQKASAPQDAYDILVQKLKQ